mgnify:CR=1 FL=1
MKKKLETHNKKVILPCSGYVWLSRFHSHVRWCYLCVNVRVWDENARKHDRYQFPQETNDSSTTTAIRVRVKQSPECEQCVSNRARLVHDPSNRARLVITKLDCSYPGDRGRVVFVLEWWFVLGFLYSYWVVQELKLIL